MDSNSKFKDFFPGSFAKPPFSKESQALKEKSQTSRNSRFSRCLDERKCEEMGKHSALCSAHAPTCMQLEGFRQKLVWKRRKTKLIWKAGTFTLEKETASPGRPGNYQSCVSYLHLWGVPLSVRLLPFLKGTENKYQWIHVSQMISHRWDHIHPTCNAQTICIPYINQSKHF